MASIRAGADLFTVVVRVRTPSADDRRQVLDICRATQHIFARQPGFVSSSLHRSHDDDAILSYLQWRTEADHEACLRSPDFETPDGRRLMQMIEEGRVEMDVRSYAVDQVIDAPDGEP
ncbi:MAG: antibiotic biosynthesis monooxygenase [Acidobacteria bacterium]|nr:antibiotic biosynthesis monooxygenase [Acidobacteriota bacterium]